MSTSSNQPVNTVTQTFPVVVTKTIEFIINTPEDHFYISSTDQEDNFFADIRGFSEEVGIKVLSVDGVKLD